ncbi:MAG: DNA polymerase III subunit chi [Gammaproteobacteria bacterium]|nr:DNA polymerase III subunit chi [Gammaproteobacteria bacterium]
MPQVEFHTLTEPGEAAQFERVCRLIEAAYGAGRRVHVHAASEALAHALDERLWSYDPVSFLPHNCVGEGPYPPPPIQLGWGEAEARNTGLLINLSDALPPWPLSRFDQIAEFVPAEEERKAQARERYRYYRDQGYAPTVQN